MKRQAIEQEGIARGAAESTANESLRTLNGLREGARFKIALINPKNPVYRTGYLDPFAIAQTSLAAVKMCTPDDAEITAMTDENYAPLDFGEIARNDLVGISCSTPNAPRAYKIADGLRQIRRDIMIVMGGIHPTFLPAEALEHCDSVVQGEAEGVWKGLLDSARAGHLKETYDGRECRPETWKIPPADSSRCIPIHVSRGCPNSCSFCCVHPMSGRKQRRVPVNEIVKTVANTSSKWPHLFAFYDDNLLVNHERAFSLSAGLRPLGINWLGMTSLDITDDEDLLHELSASGCRALLIGFETTNPDNLRSVGKRVNLARRDYKKAIGLIHKHDMSAIGSFMVGMDHDNEESLRKMVDDLIEMGVDMATFSILTPFPGTRLFDQLEAEGRLLHKDWEKYTGGNAVFQPKLMQPRVLENALDNLRRRFFSPINILRRLKSARNKTAMLALNASANWAFREKGPVAGLRS